MLTSGSTISAPAATIRTGSTQPSARYSIAQPGNGPKNSTKLSAGISTGPTSGLANSRPARDSTKRTGSARSPRVRRASSIGWPAISRTGTSSSRISCCDVQTQYSERA